VKLSTIRDYIEVLKPRESILLTFIGVCAAFIASNGQPPLDILLLAAVTILLGSAGNNGLTNYIDRGFDAKMRRTRHRVLPSKRIYPPQKVLPLLVGLALYAVSIALYFVGGFGCLYLVLANILGIIMLYASSRLMISNASRDAWRLYKLSSFPYLGLNISCHVS